MSFEDDDGRESHKQYYLPTVEGKDRNTMTDGRNFFDQPIKMIPRHMIILERLQLDKERIIGLDIY